MSERVANKRIYLSPPHVGALERELLLDAFDSNWIAPLGPHVDAFERELAERAGVGHAAALSSGTAALHLALLMLGVEAGDEVYTSTLTFAATANAISYLGGSPVFIDSERETWNFDPALLEEALAEAKREGRLPKAVVAVDIYGQCANYERIVPICAAHGVPLIEDAAEALGATRGGRPAGSFGALGVLSFNGNKIITTSGGGALLSDDEALISRARFLATQARDDAPHYEHSVIGYNYRMSNLLAALGRAQLKGLDPRIERRRETHRFYREALGELPGVGWMPIAKEGEPNYWLTCLVIDPAAFGATREAIRLHLESQNIEARPLWKPMHLQPVFARCRRVGGAIAAQLFEDGLCIPSGSSLEDGERQRVVDAIHAVHKGR